jgi:starch phosphorylase
VRYARIWQVVVGRIRLLLPTPDILEKTRDAPAVGHRSPLRRCGGEHRLLQELLLGIGGVRSLLTELTDADSELFHTNEGHAGFLGPERISDLIW